MKNAKLPTQQEIIDAALSGLTAAEDAEPIAGNCWRQTRLRLAVAGVPQSLIPPIGVDASEAAKWYRKHHPELIARNGSLPGDVLFYEIGHGEHGHVVTRVPFNKGAENSVAHAPEGEKDGRGLRPLSRIGKPTLAMRFWRS